MRSKLCGAAALDGVAIVWYPKRSNATPLAWRCALAGWLLIVSSRQLSGTILYEFLPDSSCHVTSIFGLKSNPVAALPSARLHKTISKRPFSLIPLHDNTTKQLHHHNTNHLIDTTSWLGVNKEPLVPTTSHWETRDAFQATMVLQQETTVVTTM